MGTPGNKEGREKGQIRQGGGISSKENRLGSGGGMEKRRGKERGKLTRK